MTDDAKRNEIWRRLTTGASMDSLGLPAVNGRSDLRDFVPPVDTFNTTITGRWTGLDLSGVKLPSLRFRSATIQDCVISGSSCRDWRLWDTTMVSCSLARSDLRDSALGAVADGRRNSYTDIDFSRADLTNTVHVSADYTRCRFVDTRLKGVDFAGSVFCDCVFEGNLREVLLLSSCVQRRELSCERDAGG